MSNISILLARVLLSAIFIYSGVVKFWMSEVATHFMSTKHFHIIPVLLMVVGLVEVIFGFFLAIGFKARLSALILFIYLIPVTFYVDDFWNASFEIEKQLQMFMLLKNFAILGGLLLLITNGPGKLSLDSCSCRLKENAN